MAPSKSKPNLPSFEQVLDGRNLRVGKVYLAQRVNLPSRPVKVYKIRISDNGQKEAYITFVGEDKRLDCWLPFSSIGEEVFENGASGSGPSTPRQAKISNGDEPEGSKAQPRNNKKSRRIVSTPEREHETLTRVRNFEDVRIGEYLIKTWYYSPYPPPVEDISLQKAEKPLLNGMSSIPPSSKRRKLLSTSETKTIGAPQGQGKGKHRGDSPDITSSLRSEWGPNGSSKGKGKGKVDAPGLRDMAIDPTPREPPLDVIPQSGSTILTEGSQPPETKTKGRTTKSVEGVHTDSAKRGRDGVRGRIFVCDLCFKYMWARDVWERHSSSCTLLKPPGKKVYERDSRTIYEVDGAQASIYCRGLSLFGKLFIDHKSVFYFVDDFLFYVLCEASTSERDQVIAFFSKEKRSILEDYNLACIVIFPPFQNQAFGRLLIEFSYYLTKHPSTRPASCSPGTPEQPLSDLGRTTYTTFWAGVICRYFRNILTGASPLDVEVMKSNSISPPKAVKGELGFAQNGSVLHDNAKLLKKTVDKTYKGQYALQLTLADLSKAVHIRKDDLAYTLGQMGFLSYRRPAPGPPPGDTSRLDHKHELSQDDKDMQRDPPGELDGLEVVVTNEMVDEAFVRWRAYPKALLDESYCLL